MNICILGCGYVGLVSGACFSDLGHHVTCVDVDEKKILSLKAGKCPLMEPSLSEIIARNQARATLQFTTSYEDAIPRAELVFICVQTPENEDGSCNLTYVREAVLRLAPLIAENALIITKSTVPVGTTDEMEELIRNKTMTRFHMANNPEFLREGSAVADFLQPDRVIIGTRSEFAANKLSLLYESIGIDKNKIIIMDTRSSELVKYASNAMLAMRISFANEIANLSDKVGANYKQVKIGIGTDSRIGPHFLNAGIGFGGSCFPKDLKALIHLGEKFGEPMLIARATAEVNSRQAKKILEKFDLHFKGATKNKVVAIWGLTYKPNTNDIRRAPSITLIEELLNRGCKLRVFEPSGYEKVKKILNDKATFAQSSYEALEGADALILVTEWAEFQNPDFANIRSLMRGKVVFDGRNIWERAVVESFGLTYYGVGT